MAGALTLLAEAADAKLIARPFREHPGGIAGICFCCDDCCGVIPGGDEDCDRGILIETTALEACISCGACVEYCYFECRGLSAAGLAVEREKCYGCGICAEVCPTGCVSMIEREDRNQTEI